MPSIPTIPRTVQWTRIPEQDADNGQQLAAAAAPQGRRNAVADADTARFPQRVRRPLDRGDVGATLAVASITALGASGASFIVSIGAEVVAAVLGETEESATNVALPAFLAAVVFAGTGTVLGSVGALLISESLDAAAEDIHPWVPPTPPLTPEPSGVPWATFVQPAQVDMLQATAGELETTSVTSFDIENPPPSDGAHARHRAS